MLFIFFYVILCSNVSLLDSLSALCLCFSLINHHYCNADALNSTQFTGPIILPIFQRTTQCHPLRRALLLVEQGLRNHWKNSALATTPQLQHCQPRLNPYVALLREQTHRFKRSHATWTQPHHLWRSAPVSNRVLAPIPLWPLRSQQLSWMITLPRVWDLSKGIRNYICPLTPRPRGALLCFASRSQERDGTVSNRLPWSTWIPCSIRAQQQTLQL